MTKSESTNRNTIKETQNSMTCERSYLTANLIEVLINIFTAVNDLFNEVILLGDKNIAKAFTASLRLSDWDNIGCVHKINNQNRKATNKKM